MDDVIITNFIEQLSSKNPTPGGGGASALVGAVSSALCAMVANLTVGKKKYAEYQADLEKIILRAEDYADIFIDLIDEDAKAFAPLAEAYGIPKDNPKRDEILESALVYACTAPLHIIKETENVLTLIEQLAVKGTRLAISDVGVAAAACKAAADGAVLNIYVNTKLMKNREQAETLNAEAQTLCEKISAKCEIIYQQIVNELRGNS